LSEFLCTFAILFKSEYKIDYISFFDIFRLFFQYTWFITIVFFSESAFITWPFYYSTLSYLALFCIWLSEEFFHFINKILHIFISRFIYMLIKQYFVCVIYSVEHSCYIILYISIYFKYFVVYVNVWEKSRCEITISIRKE
jgi:hypothetical protein